MKFKYSLKLAQSHKILIPILNPIQKVIAMVMLVNDFQPVCNLHFLTQHRNKAACFQPDKEFLNYDIHAALTPAQTVLRPQFFLHQVDYVPIIPW